MKILVCIFLSLIFCSQAFADKKKPIYIQLNSNGKTGYYHLGTGVNNIVLWAKTKGNLTIPFEFISTLPEGTKIDAYGGNFTTKEAVKEKKNFWNLDLYSNSDIAEKRKSCMELELGDKDDPQKPKEPNVKVTQYPDFDKDLYCKLYNWYDLKALGVDCFPKSHFSRIVTSTETDYSDHYGLFRKDACQSSSKVYVIRIDLDFSKVDWSKVTNYTANFRIKTYSYEGKKRATIKPESDGRYAPRPIILMEWLNNLCGNQMTMTKWSGGRPASPKNLPIYSFYLHADDLILGIAVVDKVLKGGKGTFELSDGYQSYGVCFDLVRKRQRVNGYN